MNDLFNFVQETCELYNIDESHGLEHAKTCVANVERLIDSASFTEEERRMAIYSVALHDMCDHKYTDVGAAAARIYGWLRSQEWTHDDAEALILIVTTMSYSKLKMKMQNEGYPDHGPWQRVYHVVRHADLLDSYSVKRCVLYQSRITPDITDADCRLRVLTLFRDRVFRYIEDGWIFLPEALRMAIEQIGTARRDLALL
jgi:hypothetical protein